MTTTYSGPRYTFPELLRPQMRRDPMLYHSENWTFAAEVI